MISTTRILAFALLAISSVSSHSWIEGLTIVGGSETSKINSKGYIRNYQGHQDKLASYQVQAPDPKDPGRPIPSLDGSVCAAFQQKSNNNPHPEFPLLTAAPGDFIQGIYLDNGHITLPPVPDSSSGKIYWYGTTDSSNVPTLREVIQWTADGKGGNGKGRLLEGPADFDDKVCAEDNGSPIAQARGIVKGTGSVPCKSTFKIPEDVKDDSIYTVYWVWDFSLHFGLKYQEEKNHIEWYTSCADIKISGGSGGTKSQSDAGENADTADAKPKVNAKKSKAGAKGGKGKAKPNSTMSAVPTKTEQRVARRTITVRF